MLFLNTVTLHLLEGVHTRMKTLLSESNYQQQDLNTIKDDLGALKFGFAILQHTTTELSADSMRQDHTINIIDRKLAIRHDRNHATYRFFQARATRVAMKLDEIIESVCSPDSQPQPQDNDTSQPQFTDPNADNFF